MVAMMDVEKKTPPLKDPPLLGKGPCALVIPAAVRKVQALHPLEGLDAGVGVAHEALPQVVEAVREVVRAAYVRVIVRAGRGLAVVVVVVVRRRSCCGRDVRVVVVVVGQADGVEAVQLVEDAEDGEARAEDRVLDVA